MRVLDARTGGLDPVLEEVAAALRAGRVVALPTDTVYGLAAALSSPEAVRELGRLKGRPASVPIAVLVADVDQAGTVGRLEGEARRLAGEHWPGELTLVVEAAPGIADLVGSGDGSVGVRCPAEDLIRRLAALVGPLATTSANRHGTATPPNAARVAAELPEVEVVVDGGPRTGTPSTVVDARSTPVRTLRQGDLRLA